MLWNKYREGLRENQLWGIRPPMDFLERLAALIRHPNWRVVYGGLRIIKCLKEFATTPEILDALGDRLWDRDEHLPDWIAEKVGELGKSTPKILAGFAHLLENPDEHTADRVTLAVARLGVEAATNEILLRLADLLTDESPVTQECAEKALRALGRSAESPELLARLDALLADPSPRVRIAVETGIQRIWWHRARNATAKEVLAFIRDRII
jgi:hypothetical protein